MLYNILLIIDFQKQLLVEQSNRNSQTAPNYLNNECIIEEDENEEDTEQDCRNTHKNDEDTESDLGVVMRSHDKDLLFDCQNTNSQRNSGQHEYQKHEEIFTLQCKESPDGNYNSSQNYKLKVNHNARYSCDEHLSDSNHEDETHRDPPPHRAIPVLQNETHKSLFSPSLMKINESPKVSLLTDRSSNSSRNPHKCND